MDIHEVTLKYEPYDQLGWFVSMEEVEYVNVGDEGLHLDAFTASLLSTVNYLKGCI